MMAFELIFGKYNISYSTVSGGAPDIIFHMLSPPPPPPPMLRESA
jgi:hypothetical protein